MTAEATLAWLRSRQSARARTTMWDTLYRLYLVVFIFGAPVAYVVTYAVTGCLGRLDGAGARRAAG